MLRLADHRRFRLGVDVDGVVADLMGGFEDFIWAEFGLRLRPEEITRFHIAKSPAHRELHEKVDLDRQLARFLAVPDVYEMFVSPIPGAVEAVARLAEDPHLELVFITATLHESPGSYAAKYRWLDHHFPRVPVISCPSGNKHWFDLDAGIDDRFDTCQRWERSGVTPLLFRQPWNEAPEDFPSYDWEGVLRAIERELQ